LKISHILWLDEIIEKIIQKHQVSQEEVRQILKSSTHFRFVEKGHQTGENLYLALGQTNAGRYLTVFFVYKKNKQALVVSGRDMTNAERKKYEKK
jgi:uncharacterized DUF497 family protein